MQNIENTLKKYNISNSIKWFDIYPKLDEDVQIQTSSGAFVSIFGWMIILLLSMYEINSYLCINTTEHMMVDRDLNRKLNINMNITFHALTCAEIHLDAMDVAGDNQINVEHDIVKRRLSPINGQVIGSPVTSGLEGQPTKEQLEAAKKLEPLPNNMDNYCGSCYGAENPLMGIKCCNTCEELKIAYNQIGWGTTDILKNSTQCIRDIHNPWTIVQEGEGCRVEGIMEVNKVAGNFHIAHGESIVRDGRHIHQFHPNEVHKFNISHTINYLSFGDDLGISSSSRTISGSKSNSNIGSKNGVNSLIFEEDDGSDASDAYNVNSLQSHHHHVSHEVGTGLYQYYLYITPTTYTDAWGKIIHTNTYTFTERFRPVPKDSKKLTILPGIFFIYELTPFSIEINGARLPLAHFLSRLCAIVGGVFTLLACIDNFLHSIEKKKK